MRDNRLRALAKRIARWRYETDLQITRWLAARTGGESQVRLTGSCNGCGACCQTPMVQVHTVVFFAKSLRWLVLAWHRHVNGFEFIGDNRRDRTLIFRCTHFDALTRRCDSYATRPGMCRDYPLNLLDGTNPQLPAPCSYRLEALNAAEIRASLAQLDLSAAQRDHLAASFNAALPEPDTTLSENNSSSSP